MPRTPPARPSKQASSYEETPDYGTLFQREDGTPPRPQFTGAGVLSAETLQEIMAAGGEFQISLWTKSKDGGRMRNRNGSYRFRVHIEPPYEPAAEPAEPEARPPEEDDIPF